MPKKKKKTTKKKSQKKVTRKASSKAGAPEGSRQVKGEFYVPIKAPEYERLTKERTAHDIERMKLEAERSELSKRISALKKVSEEISRSLDEKKIKKSIEAMEHRDFDTNTVRLYYDGDVIEERAMTADDRQEKMDLDNDKAKKALEDEARKKKKKKASKKASKSNDEVAEVIAQETRKQTKRSALDGGYSKDRQLGG